MNSEIWKEALNIFDTLMKKDDHQEKMIQSLEDRVDELELQLNLLDERLSKYDRWS